jgi:DNA-binding transcriptional LysR family regulator
MNNFHWQ